MNYKVFLVFVLLGSFGCSKKINTIKVEDHVHFGERITSQNAMSYDQLLNRLATKNKLTAKVKGRVLAVCQAKGCWMTIKSNKPNTPVMFVKFKDYGFFMPKDIAGRKVIMQGEAYYEVTTVEELKHYAEDEGLPVDAISKITQAKKELKFLATGVILQK
jgi:hypothetical protein